MVGTVAQRMFNAVMMDQGSEVTSACIVDFCLGFSNEDITASFGALQTAARNGATPEEFDEAIGSTQKLTELVSRYGSSFVFPKMFYED